MDKIQAERIEVQEQEDFEQMQDIFNLELELNAFSDHNIKNLRTYNSQKLQCHLLKMSSQFYNLIQKIAAFQQFCSNYRQSLIATKEQNLVIKIQNKMGMKTQNKMDLQYDINRQQSQKNFIILPVKRLQSSQKDITLLINKLKVLTIKVKTIQSSKFQYIYSTYMTKLKETLQKANINQKLFRSHTINRILQYLNKNFTVINLQTIFLYPYHITRYPSSSQNFLFFIHLHCQQLLFINSMPLSSSQQQSQMLYCPIILQTEPTKHVKISQWYKSRLTQIQPLWRGYILMVQVYHFETSFQKSIYTSHLIFKPFLMPAFLTRSYEEANKFSSFFNYEQERQSHFLKELTEIRQFVYQKLIFNYLMQVLKAQGDSCCSLSINGGFKVSFQVHKNTDLKNQIINKQKFNTEQNYKPELIAELLKFVKCKDLWTKNKSLIHQNLCIAMQSAVFRVISEQIQYRTSNPNYPGSMDLYFYQKKNIGRLSVKRFLEQFGKTK